MALKREHCFDSPYYVYIRRLLTIVGLWPYLTISKRLASISFIIIFMAGAFIVQVCIMLKSERNVETITKFMETILPVGIFTVAYCYLVYNSALVKEILERVRHDWNKLTCEDEFSIIETYAAQSKVCSHLIACGFLLYTVVLILPSILSFFQYIFGTIDKNKLILPVHKETFVATKLRFYIMFILQLLAISTTYIIGITHYLMFISFLQHACALFVIVTNKMDQPFIINEYFDWQQTPPNNKREVEYKWIVNVVKNYNNAIRFTQLITSLYEKIYIVEISAFCCLIIIDFIYLFQLLNFMSTAIEALKICVHINGTLLITYAYFYLGERLTDHSTSVYAKCQLVPFYKLSVTTNKLFLLLIMRSIKPCNLSIKGTVVASYELFAKIIKASFSFATIFYNVN